MAAPRPRLDGVTGPDPALDPITIERTYAAAFKAAQETPPSGPGTAAAGTASQRAMPAPAYAAEVQARGGENLYRANRLPESQGIRPEFQNSGRWIAQPGT